ncbi:glycosyltransferase involved in cell wall biosynthesis [Streptosporangium becharense]|uniref:Glycosyltransferase involved in cell wall biosynthesis n=1 Tax=Streptosporangium becharense TaxID=1816182 RepID=A0A7W9IFN6_9ACTN|nr:glycosyltransferase family 2 protein [Streptosporangium becharense]MBB2909367.1 glycosyltransferase involved in cell wall biosynthesis [Streptosporangium becharense]MBB5819676.1 glycosyltransferase involved in cell wall biosynthesis [Streptosporangium becharense]
MTGTILQRVRTGRGGCDITREEAARRDVDVTVIVPVHNCRSYLDRCLTSLLVQRVALEIVVVDDGSTDGGADLLDLYASYHRGVVRVIRQEASGGAGRPRNVGLAHARGRYVFFCDADDYLGPEALERMLAMADRNGSDIVLGKIVGHDRRAPVSMFRENAERVPLGDSAVYNSLSCFKLFRREMLERYGIRFDETLLVGEDLVFTAHAYCHAEVISVVADYDCYHLVDRPDGTSIMQRPGSRDPVAWLRMIRRPIEIVLAHVCPGDLRDHLLRRHFRLDAFGNLGRPFLEAGEVERKEIVAEVADMCERWLTDGVRARLPAIDRSRIAALEDIDRLVRLAHIESAVIRRELTGLRWDAQGRLVVSGRVALEVPEQYGRPEIPGGTPVLVLRRRHDGLGAQREAVVPVTGGCAEFTGIVDACRLPPGVWDVHVRVDFEGVPRLARLGAGRDGRVAPPEPRVAGAVVALPYFTRPYGNLSVDVGGHVTAVPGCVRLACARWASGHRLVLDGEVTVCGEAVAASAVRHLVWRERESGRERRQPVTAGDGGTFTARQAMGRLSPGTWDAYLELDLGGPPARFRIEAAPEAITEPRTWWRGAVRWSVRPYATAGKGRLSTVVRTLGPRTFVRRMVR